MFKSLTPYQITLPAHVLLERLPKALDSKPFAKCLDKQPRSRGFVPPLGSGEITYSANGGTLFCLRTDEKSVPASAVKELVNDRRAKVEEDGGEFSKVDERVAKEEIAESFLPGIPPATSLAYGYIDKELSMLFLSCTGDAADEFTKFLGEALGGNVPLKLLGIKDDPCDKFTAWVRDTELLGDAFELGTQGALKHEGGEGGCGIMNIKHEDFESEEMLSLIEAGRQVCSIALIHEDMQFRLTSLLGFRNIRLADDVIADAADDDGRVARADEFAGFVTAMREVVRAVEPLLGGWPVQEVLDLQEEDAA